MMVLGGGALMAAGRGLDVSPELISEDLPVMLLTSLACLPIFWTRGRISRLEGCCSASMRFTSPTTSCREPSWLIGRMNTGCCCSVW